jgi:hypothetical protein
VDEKVDLTGLFTFVQTTYEAVLFGDVGRLQTRAQHA